jgi:hypothetical protein
VKPRALKQADLPGVFKLITEGIPKALLKISIKGEDGAEIDVTKGTKIIQYNIHKDCFKVFNGEPDGVSLCRPGSYGKEV